MVLILTIVQTIAAVLLVGAILLQQRGGGLSPVLGGDSSVYRTRRGVEKGVFVLTIILAVLFLLAAALNIFLR